jgi:peptidoglycan/xylan/chitin deacetylase (PgdA/CDA1 family)
VRHGYQSLTFADIKTLMEKGESVPSNAVVITFDDGYQNNYTEAFPLMREKGLRGVIFLVVQTIGWDNNWHDPATETRIPMLTWAQVEEMKKTGFEFGSHTMTHANLENIEIQYAVVEIEKSRRVMGETLGNQPVSFAYPYGAGQDSALLREIVRQAGYTFGISIHQGKAALTNDLYCLKRIFVRGDDTLFDFHLNMTRGKARF